MSTSTSGPRSTVTASGLLADAGHLLLVLLCVPVAIFIVGAPFALLARLALELFERL